MQIRTIYKRIRRNIDRKLYGAFGGNNSNRINTTKSNPVRSDFAKKNNSTMTAALPLCLLFIGIVAGAVYANMAYDEVFSDIEETLNSILEAGSSTLDPKGTFMLAAFKYLRIVLSLWVAGLFAPGIVIIICMLLYKSFAYGFTTAVLLKMYGLYGLVVAFNAFVPQNLFFLPAMFFVSKTALKMIFCGLSGKKIDKAEYGIALLIAAICALIAALIETFVSPVLIGKIW